METKQQYTTIRVSVKLWKKLNELKINPSQTPEDIVWKLIDFKFNGEKNDK